METGAAKSEPPPVPPLPNGKHGSAVMRWCVGIGALVWVAWIVWGEIAEMLNPESYRWGWLNVVVVGLLAVIAWAATQLLRKKRMALAVKMIACLFSVNGVVMGPGVVAWTVFPEGPPEWIDTMATPLVATLVAVAFYLWVVSWTLLPPGARLKGSRMLIGVTVCWILGLESGVLVIEVIREAHTTAENPYGRLQGLQSVSNVLPVLVGITVGYLCRRVFRAPVPSWDLRLWRRRKRRS